MKMRKQSMEAVSDGNIAFDGPCGSDYLIVFHGWDGVRAFYEDTINGVGVLEGVIGFHVGTEPDFTKRIDNDAVELAKDYGRNNESFVVYVDEIRENAFLFDLACFCDATDDDRKARFDQMMNLDAERSVHNDGKTVVYVLQVNALYCVYRMIETEKLVDGRWVAATRPEIAFTDEYDTCVQCNKIMRTSPNSYFWMPDYFLIDGEGYMCLDCLRAGKDYFIEQMKSLAERNKAVSSPIPPIELGYEQVSIHDSYGTKTTWQNGLHHGMADSPDAQFKKLRAAGIELPLFVFERSQFYAEWEIWVKPEDMEKAEEVLQGASNDGSDQESPSPAEKMKDFLQNAPVTKVSAQDFIDGNIPDGPVKLEIDHSKAN